MKYRLRGRNDYLIDPIKTVLNNRGITDIEGFLNLDESVTHDWGLLNNIDTAVDCLLNHIYKNNKIFVQFDSDADGISSSAILINYLNKLFPSINIQWRIHEGKEHGIIIDTVPDDVGLVIIPDAGSNQYKEHKILKERGIDVIVLDHHECEKESEFAIVVNNQLSANYPNKNFSGAGITYKFIKALDSKLGTNEADYYLDLVAFGNIADNIDMRELETRYYVLKGLKHINNSFLKALIDKQEYSTKGNINITNVSFYIAPLVNAAIRVGNLSEKLNMIKSFLESKELIFNNKTSTYERIQVAMARSLVNIKNRQKKLRDEGVNLIEERIHAKNLLNNKILIVNVTNILDKNLTGLVANQIADKFKRPTLLLRQKDESNNFAGSARGYEKGVIKDLKKFLLDTGNFVMCEGHSNAFGIEIEPNKILETINLINELLKDVEIDTELYEVDFIIPSKQLTSNFVFEIAKLKNIWGYKVEEPLVAIRNLSIDKDSIQVLGKSKNTLKFTYRDIEFIKFFADDLEVEKQFDGESFEIDVVGRCSENEWGGIIKPQIIIEDYKIVNVKRKEFVF